MEFTYGDTIRILSNIYVVLGRIAYCEDDGEESDSDTDSYKTISPKEADWFEYLLVSNATNEEYWLSCDKHHNGYALYRMCEKRSTDTYRLLEAGTEKAVSVWGNVDVDIGDSAEYKEFITETGAIYAVEKWSDETEYAEGMYLTTADVTIEKDVLRSNAIQKCMARRRILQGILCIPLVIWALLILMAITGTSWHTVRAYLGHPYTINEYMSEDAPLFTYVTSITGNDGEKSTIYQSPYATVGETVRTIINAMEGRNLTTYQHEINEDNAVALLTPYEYCLIYEDTEHRILVRDESRQFAYAGTDDSGYYATPGVHRFYRNFYWSFGYEFDKKRYTSPSFYDTYQGVPLVDDPVNMYYQNYASSVRSGSAGSRLSSGGGTSVGK